MLADPSLSIIEISETPLKKWEKIQAKAIDGNLKEDSKTLWDRGQSLIKIHKDKKELQQKKLGNLEVLIKTIEREKSKQVYESIIAEIENYQGSGSNKGSSCRSQGDRIC